METGSALEPMDLGENEAEAASDDPISASVGALPHGQQQQAALIQVNDSTALDLEILCQQYTGYALMQHLLFVADVCPSLKREALNALILYVQRSTLNVCMYQQAHGRMQQSLSDNEPQSPSLIAASTDGEMSMSLPVYDQNWVDSATKKAQLKMDRLDADLKHYKNNSIKESIRRGQDELGDHYLEVGNLSDALKCYNRARDYCTSYKHILNMCFNVIKVAAYLHNWQLVASYVTRAETGAESAAATGGESSGGSASQKEAASQRSAALARLKAAAGLAELAHQKYRSAARYFLQIEMDHFDYPELISAKDVAVYGSLCALATYSRVDLQKNVLQNNGFKQFLELEPQLNELIRRFNDSAYDKCLAIMDANRNRLLLDPYLSPHVNSLFDQVRRRGIVQYFSPFLSADMNLMAAAFQATVAHLEDELTILILSGEINARIDSGSKTLYAKDVDERSAAYKRALDAGHSMEERARAVMLRAALHRAKICVTRNGVTAIRGSVSSSLASLPDVPSSASGGLANQLSHLLATVASSGSSGVPPAPSSSSTSNNNAPVSASDSIDTPPDNSPSR